MTKSATARAAPGTAGDLPKARLPIDDALFFKLIRVVNLMARPFSEQIGRANRITLNEWRVMLVLASHPGSAAREVALHSGLDKMTVSRAIAGLGRRRRIARQVDLNDKRRTRLWLNATGQKVYERIGTLAGERERRLFSQVSATAQAQMGRTLDRLIDTLLAFDSEAE